MRRIPAVSNSSIFGPNAWLIDEQFQQYSKDPNSVDKEWRDYFEANGAPKNAASAPAAAAQSSAKKSTPAKPAADSTAPNGAPAAKPAKVAEKPGKDSDSKKNYPDSPLDRIGEAPEAGERQLKGMFKAIAKNMDESLEIPTATTVRDVPVKLMWENRAMINDHLKRTRGGKISFTHILGYAPVSYTHL